jgi:hypothetical protein
MSPEEKQPDIFETLNRAALDHLQGKYGHEVRVKTTRAALNEILNNIDRKNLGEVATPAEYDKGFDRTSPGYDKTYDRDRADMSERPDPPPVTPAGQPPKAN